ncbi:hypothetical protein [Phenylobacterium sp. NIBR 498073]|uniref:hypothetical protein n=1 Tax=Phenylobacterium sp. NIBR 498073 TaxID=3015177 RepID=UPI0022B3346D|nr:hypothetical protein [Phenylobacterium sp. NIBR 498073]WGU41494.1 hypothetical protein O4N75_07155 [Phenylobacterium sp. NIBR 498073]
MQLIDPTSSSSVETGTYLALWLPTKAQAALSSAWTLANSGFAIALLSALAGSFAGAYGAQLIAERDAARRRALEELRATNAASSLAIFTVNALIALKRQHLRPLLQQYRTDRTRFIETITSGRGGLFAYTADWQIFPWTEVPTDALTELIFNRIDAAHPITLINMLNGTIEHLRKTLKQRDDYVAQMLARGAIPAPEAAALYFGQRMPDGRQDSRYPDLLDAAENYVDSAILFGTVLIERLIKHAEMAVEKMGKRAPHVIRANFAAPMDDGLIPAPGEYAEVLTNMGVDPTTALQSLRLDAEGRPLASGHRASLRRRFTSAKKRNAAL